MVFSKGLELQPPTRPTSQNRSNMFLKIPISCDLPGLPSAIPGEAQGSSLLYFGTNEKGFVVVVANLIRIKSPKIEIHDF